MKGMGARGWPGLIGDSAARREGSGSRSGNPTLSFPHHSWLEMTYKNLRLSHFRKSLRIGPHLNSEGLTTPESEPTFMTQITPIFGAAYLVSKTQPSGIPSQAKSLSCPGQAPHSGEGCIAARFGGFPASVSWVLLFLQGRAKCS